VCVNRTLSQFVACVSIGAVVVSAIADGVGRFALAARSIGGTAHVGITDSGGLTPCFSMVRRFEGGGEPSSAPVKWRMRSCTAAAP
jgi:hypothetical protein